jgi:hypothetical protein
MAAELELRLVLAHLYKNVTPSHPSFLRTILPSPIAIMESLEPTTTVPNVPNPYDPSFQMSLSEMRACWLLSDILIDLNNDIDQTANIAENLCTLGLTRATLKDLFVNDVFPVVWLDQIGFEPEWCIYPGRWLMGWISFRRRWRCWRWCTMPFHAIAWYWNERVVMEAWEKVAGLLEETGEMKKTDSLS